MIKKLLFVSLLISQLALGRTFIGPSLFSDVPSATTSNVIFEVKSVLRAAIPAPVMTTTQRLAIPAPVAGMVVYDTTVGALYVYAAGWSQLASITFAALGDLQYGSGAGTSALLSGNTTTTKKFLSQTGNGTISAAPSWNAFTAPTVQRLAAASGTYTTPAGVFWIKVRILGAGGGGSGSGTGAGGAATAGTATTFGTALLSAPGGSPGVVNTTGTGGAGGGACTINSPAITVLDLVGSSGGSGSANGAVSGDNTAGPSGGNAPLFAGGGRGGTFGKQAGQSGVNGGGGGGGSTDGTANAYTGAAGGSGSYCEAIIPSPSATYSWVLGVGGNGGSGGANGASGGAGGNAWITVEEYYQ